MKAKEYFDATYKDGTFVDMFVFAEAYSEHQNKAMIEENEKKDIQLTEAMNTLSILRKDANEADHADYCMCRFCCPEFHKLKEAGNPSDFKSPPKE